MCILEDVGLEVEVLVNHRATKEYPYRQPNSDGGLDTTAVCRRYIQSEDGAVFSFRCSVRAGESAAREWLKTPSNAILFEVNIDDREGLKSVARYVELAAPSTTIRALPDIANEQQRWFRFTSIPTGLSLRAPTEKVASLMLSETRIAPKKNGLGTSTSLGAWECSGSEPGES